MHIPLSIAHAMHTQAEKSVWVKVPGDVNWERDLFSRWVGWGGGGGHK